MVLYSALVVFRMVNYGLFMNGMITQICEFLQIPFLTVIDHQQTKAKWFYLTLICLWVEATRLLSNNTPRLFLRIIFSFFISKLFYLRSAPGSQARRRIKNLVDFDQGVARSRLDWQLFLNFGCFGEYNNYEGRERVDATINIIIWWRNWRLMF